MALSTFTAGQKLRASQLNVVIDALNVASASANDVTSRTTTSTTFTGLMSPTGLCGVAFTAPPSGKVSIQWAVELRNSSTFFTECSPAIRTGTTVGSGTTVLAASLDNSIRSDQSTLLRMGSSYLLTGLTAGASYNVSLEQLVGNATSTGTFVRRTVSVIPLAG